MAATMRAIKHKYWSDPFRMHINIDDAFTDAELSAIAFAKLKVNGSHSQQKQFCDCPECRINGRRFALHRVPVDCEYSVLRSALVSAAERIANKRVAVFGNGGNDGKSARWTKCFSTEMDRLSA